MHNTFVIQQFAVRWLNIPQIPLLCTLHQGHSRSHHPQTPENPAGFTSHQALWKSGEILSRTLKALSYVEVPEGEDSDNHGRCGPAFAVGAVEDEGRARVLGQGALHGLQELIKILQPRSHVIAPFPLLPFIFCCMGLENRSKKRTLN